MTEAQEEELKELETDKKRRERQRERETWWAGGGETGNKHRIMLFETGSRRA